jgi:hypothetical protein
MTNLTQIVCGQLKLVFGRRTGPVVLVPTMLLTMVALSQVACAQDRDEMKFERVSMQYVAALGGESDSSGSGAQAWGLWPVDPGPRGVRLKNYDQLQSSGGRAPAGWQLDNTDWWLEENGLLMEQPEFPLAPGQYMVTGGRDVTTVLTVYPPDEQGDSRWELADGATLYDVTHLGCRSARYTPAPGTEPNSCSPAKAPQSAFRVAPGAEMPPVEGCAKQDYAVLFIVAVGVTESI